MGHVDAKDDRVLVKRLESIPLNGVIHATQLLVELEDDIGEVLDLSLLF